MPVTEGAVVASCHEYDVNAIFRVTNDLSDEVAVSTNDPQSWRLSPRAWLSKVLDLAIQK